MKTVLELLRRKVPAKSAEIRAALDALPSDASATAAIVVLEGERRTALVDGLVDDDVAEIERKIDGAKRERDRTVALREELAIRLRTAESLEAVDALAERKIKAEVESRDLAKKFEARFLPLVDELVDLMQADRANTNECLEIDRQLAAIGTTDRVTRASRPNYGIAESTILSLAGTRPAATVIP